MVRLPTAVAWHVVKIKTSTHDSTALEHRPIEALVDQVLSGMRVHSRKGVIEEHVLGVGVDGTGKGHSGLLAATK